MQNTTRALVKKHIHTQTYYPPPPYTNQLSNPACIHISLFNGPVCRPISLSSNSVICPDVSSLLRSGPPFRSFDVSFAPLAHSLKSLPRMNSEYPPAPRLAAHHGHNNYNIDARSRLIQSVLQSNGCDYSIIGKA